MTRNEWIYFIAVCLVAGMIVPPAVVVIGPIPFMVGLAITFMVLLAIQEYKKRKECH